MSTKNISRSALEGGRNKHNKYERNQSHRNERSRAREWLGDVNEDPEHAEYSDPVPRNPVYKGFTDKLNPCYRWLASRCGQPWAKVYSELTEKFDTRNLASWHIVNQHMLPDVAGAGTARDGIGGRLGDFDFRRFYIDEGGILRDRGKYHWRGPRTKRTGPTEKQVIAWANGRGVIDYGVVQFWAERTLDGLGVTRGWRQTVRFTKEEAAYWATIYHRLQDKWIVGPK